MSKVNYIIGDATEPVGDGLKIIVHSCNSEGGWGKGFVLAISKKWKEPEQKYREWAARCYNEKRKLPLGYSQIVECQSDIWVANIIAQEGYSTKDSPAFKLEAFRKGLQMICPVAKARGVTIHLPRVGMGLGGFSDWNQIEKVLIEELCDKGIDVYDLAC